jgi:NAD(P)-dependent dehydrogenase (short-subunit alcohol dehydrogenase family)
MCLDLSLIRKRVLKMQLKGKHVVLTGGQGGIGSLLAARLKAQGAKLTLIARQAGEDTLNKH